MENGELRMEKVAEGQSGRGKKLEIISLNKPHGNYHLKQKS
jgi:hypothetical protein